MTGEVSVLQTAFSLWVYTQDGAVLDGAEFSRCWKQRTVNFHIMLIFPYTDARIQHQTQDNENVFSDFLYFFHLWLHITSSIQV